MIGTFDRLETKPHGGIGPVKGLKALQYLIWKFRHNNI